LTGFAFEAEHLRLQYLARLAGSNHTKVNIVTGNCQTNCDSGRIFLLHLFRISVLLLLVTLSINLINFQILFVFKIVVAIAAVFGVVLY